MSAFGAPEVGRWTGCAEMATGEEPGERLHPSRRSASARTSIHLQSRHGGISSHCTHRERRDGGVGVVIL